MNKPSISFSFTVPQPSRELAEQTYDQIDKFKKFLTNPSPRVQLLMGGVNAKEQVAAIARGVSFFSSSSSFLFCLCIHSKLCHRCMKLGKRALSY